MDVTLRRARPALGTLVDIGVCCTPATATASHDLAQAALVAAFAAVAEVEACLSRHRPDSDLGRFHGLKSGESIPVHAQTVRVLQAARMLATDSGGLFDISLGSGPDGWDLRPDAESSSPSGFRLYRHQDGTCLDAGGIAKGHAVDAAIDAMQGAGCTAGWVNAGGDLRCFGPIDLPLFLRDEHQGGTRAIGHLRDGAWATSHFRPPGDENGDDCSSRSQLHTPHHTRCSPAHVSVAAPLCLWADALTKIVALTQDIHHPLLDRHGATAWWHPTEPGLVDTARCSLAPVDPAP